MKNYLHVETYYSDESCGMKNIYQASDGDRTDRCTDLFAGITHITEEQYPLISDLAAGLLQQDSVYGKQIDTILIFAICSVKQVCIWCISVKLRKNSNNQYGINILNMDTPMEKESCLIEYV